MRSGSVHRDVEYVEQALLLELDGRLGHELALDRWDDLERPEDLVAATTGRLTLRAGWGQVIQPCRLAGMLARLLRFGDGPESRALAVRTVSFVDVGSLSRVRCVRSSPNCAHAKGPHPRGGPSDAASFPS